MIGFLIYLLVAVLLAIIAHKKSKRAVLSLLKNKDFWMLEAPAFGLYLMILLARRS